MVQNPDAPDRGARGPGSPTGPAARFLHEALEAYEGGRYAQAEGILQQVVEQRPGNGSAWHLRGLTASRAGNPNLAIDCLVRAVACDKSNARYCAALAGLLTRLGRDGDAAAPWRRAVDIDPKNAAWQSESARCLSRLSRHDEALPYFRAALRQSPGDAALHAAYAYALQRLDRAAEAVEQYRNALGIDPRRDEARLNLATALRDMGDEEAAAAQCREVLRRNPLSVSALNNLGAALCRLGRIDEAVRQLEAAMRLEPENLTTLHNLGVALDAAGAAAEAETCLRKALALRPGFPDVHRSLGNLLRGSRRLEEAALHYRAVVESRPLDFRSYGNLGLVLLNLNRPHDALAVYEKALALQDRPDIRTSLGIAQLLIGDFENGWANYDARRDGDRASVRRPGYGAVPWRSESGNGCHARGTTPTVLIHAEQGFGDTLQFCRYLPLVSATGAHVVFECQPSLAELVATLPKASPALDLRIISRDDPAPAADYHAPLLSLPRIFGTTLDTIPAQVPYLAVPPAKSAVWAAFPFEEGLNVGLVWSGNPGRQDDHMRSCPFEALAPLFENGAVRFYGLGKNAAPALPVGIVDLGPVLSDFGDTAAVMERLDLVISVDTAAAHLAGALGRPVWVMLGHAADWRYLLDREDSPWYPTMRLFRQKAPGDWLSVTRRVAEALRRFQRL